MRCPPQFTLHLIIVLYFLPFGKFCINFLYPVAAFLGGSFVCGVEKSRKASKLICVTILVLKLNKSLNVTKILPCMNKSYYLVVFLKL